MGADDNDAPCDSFSPVGTRTVEVEVAGGRRIGGLVDFVSEKDDCADSGRGGAVFAAAKRAFLWALIVSLRLGFAEAPECWFVRELSEDAAEPCGLLGSRSRSVLDLISSVDIMLGPVSQ